MDKEKQLRKFKGMGSAGEGRTEGERRGGNGEEGREGRGGGERTPVNLLECAQGWALVLGRWLVSSHMGFVFQRKV